MENVLANKEISLKVDCEIGDNWRDVK